MLDEDFMICEHYDIARKPVVCQLLVDDADWLF